MSDMAMVVRYTKSEKAIAQRTAALQRANDVRIPRAQLKRDIKAGKVKLVDVLLEPPACAVTMPLFDLLMAVPKVGRVKARKVLADVQLSPSRPVGGLTERERWRLARLAVWL